MLGRVSIRPVGRCGGEGMWESNWDVVWGGGREGSGEIWKGLEAHEGQGSRLVGGGAKKRDTGTNLEYLPGYVRGNSGLDEGWWRGGEGNGGGMLGL